jgi:hypothetical protein
VAVLITLIHSVAKLFSKILANRLRPKMEALVSANQSAFIKTRSLHDHLMLVRQLAKKIKARKEKGVLLKLDISRAFDSISWSFLFEVLRQLGFSELFLSWLAILLRTASTEVLVNGIPGRRFRHGRGLRQGDPLSPVLFVCGMEVLTALVAWATQQNLLGSIGGCDPKQRISIYADDVVLFLKPTTEDLVAVRELLRMFGDASGLHINYQKSTATLIKSSNQDTQLVSDLLQCPI